MYKCSSWTSILTGAIPTLKNNNPDKKIATNPDDNNPDINADKNNLKIPVNCGYFVGNYFFVGNFIIMFFTSLFAIYIALLYN